MTSSGNYKYTLFKKANINPICGKSTFKRIHKVRNKIKANAKFAYSNLGGGAHGQLGLVLTNTQYTIILPTPFVYLTQPGPLIIPGCTNAHNNSNM